MAKQVSAASLDIRHLLADLVANHQTCPDCSAGRPGLGQELRQGFQDGLEQAVADLTLAVQNVQQANQHLIDYQAADGHCHYQQGYNQAVQNYYQGYRAGWSALAREPGHLDRPGYEMGYQAGRRREHGTPDWQAFQTDYQATDQNQTEQAAAVCSADDQKSDLDTWEFAISDIREFDSDDPYSSRFHMDAPEDRSIGIGWMFPEQDCAIAAAGLMLTRLWNQGVRWRSDQVDIDVSLKKYGGGMGGACPADARKQAKTHYDQCLLNCSAVGRTDPDGILPDDDPDGTEPDGQATDQQTEQDDLLSRLYDFATSDGCERLGNLLYDRTGQYQQWNVPDVRASAGRSGDRHIRACWWCRSEWQAWNDTALERAEQNRAEQQALLDRHQAIQQTDQQATDQPAGQVLFVLTEQPDGWMLSGTTAGQVLLNQMVAGDYPGWSELLTSPQELRHLDEMIDETLSVLDVPVPDDDVDALVRVVRLEPDHQATNLAIQQATSDQPDQQTEQAVLDDDVEYDAGYRLGLTQQARPAVCSDRFRAGYIDGRMVADDVSDPDYPEQVRPDIQTLMDRCLRSALRLDDVSLNLDGRQADLVSADTGSDACPVATEQTIQSSRPDIQAWTLAGGGIHNGLTIRAGLDWNAGAVKSALLDELDGHDAACSATGGHSVSARRTGRSWSVYVRCLDERQTRQATTTGLLSVQHSAPDPDDGLEPDQAGLTTEYDMPAEPGRCHICGYPGHKPDHPHHPDYQEPEPDDGLDGQSRAGWNDLDSACFRSGHQQSSSVPDGHNQAKSGLTAKKAGTETGLYGISEPDPELDTADFRPVPGSSGLTLKETSAVLDGQQAQAIEQSRPGSATADLNTGQEPVRPTGQADSSGRPADTGTGQQVPALPAAAARPALLDGQDTDVSECAVPEPGLNRHQQDTGQADGRPEAGGLETSRFANLAKKTSTETGLYGHRNDDPGLDSLEIQCYLNHSGPCFQHFSTRQSRTRTLDRAEALLWTGTLDTAGLDDDVF